MRSTNEIIIAVKECQPVTVDELKLALIVQSNINHFITDALRKLIEAIKKGKEGSFLRAAWAETTLESMFQAAKKDPEVWLQPDNIPGNPEHDKRYTISKKVLTKVLGAMGIDETNEGVTCPQKK